MFWLLQHEAAGAAKTAEHAGAGSAEHAGAAGAEHAEGAAHHTPVIVEWVNHWIGEPVHHFQVKNTKPLWDAFFGKFGTSAEAVFGPYTVENAVPWYTVMFVIACLITIVIVRIMKGRMLSEDEPSNRQQVLESGVLALRQLLYDNVGPHGMKYFPVIATFGLLILVSNLMPLFPGLMPPTASTSVTFALGISSFVYYNYIGIRENGLFGHLRHFAGPVLFIAPLMFPIELISNFVRPISLGVRLFGNIFGDEQVAATISGLAPWVVPVVLMPLSVFVAFMQTFIFILLSMIYIGEVSHAAHDEHGEHHSAEHPHDHAAPHPGGAITAPDLS
ncbi:MAG TPA: F0F1 ATP synthase subunit A [Pyrinomonadaceae bacterium]|jgi:F-type H+-transporting ATPase subunit a